jgi:crotonobetainyl-CoA:carnitine CoA-transferase CaiB-like acyl-CoA transferase
MMGNDNFTAAPSGTFRTKDGFINIAANKQEQWEAVAEVLGVPELKTDSRFQERDARKKNRKELTPLLEAKLTQRDTAEWVDALNERDVPSGAILDLSAAVSQKQITHRNTFGTVQAEGVGDIRLFNLTAKFSRTPGSVESPPPTLGQHTQSVLKSIGYSDAEIQNLKERKII